jgi:predicted Zn-dependent protease with MMP-like domain
MPPIVTLFRQPLLREWSETGVRFDDLVTHVVVHEIGHHFGFTDETMHMLEDGEEF